MSRYITGSPNRQARHAIRWVLALPMNRGFRRIDSNAFSGAHRSGVHKFHTYCASKSEVPKVTAPESQFDGNRKFEADFKAAVGDFLREHGDVYQSGRYDGRPSIRLHSSNPVNKPDIQKRLSFFVKMCTESGSDSEHPPISIEIAKNVYIQLNSRIGSEVSVTIEFDRTIAGNSLNSTILESLAVVFECLKKVSSLRGVLLMGAPGHKSRAFSCGADIKEMQQLGNADEASIFIKRISRLCTAIRHLQAPVVCGIDGPALGAGLEVAASCDIRVATRQSSFAMPEVNLAIPSVVEARLLYEIIGVSRTKHFLLTGESLDADTAMSHGLVTKLFDDRSQLLEWSSKLLKQFCASLNVHSEQKDLMRVWESSTLEDGISAGISAFARRFESSLGCEVRNHMQSHWNKLKSGRR